MKKRLLSGVKATGKVHIGNYFGAMKQFADLLKTGDYETFVFVADYHSLNSVQDASTMRALTLDLVKDYVAIGLDPETATLFKQSDVPEHTELCWIFDTITTVPYLRRAHAYKAALDKARKAVDMDILPPENAREEYVKFLLRLEENLDISVGTFNYPMLMAADILLYSPDVVPVGQDQKQHIEYTRDTAEKFNRTFGEAFKLPEAVIPENVATVPGTDGQKMSKSYNNTIPLFGTKDAIAKAVMGIVTDSSGDVPANVYAIHKLFKTEAELAPLYEANQGSYKVLKEALLEDIEAMVAPMREKRASITDDDVRAILKAGGEKARAIASAKMQEVREKIGVSL